MDVFKTWYGPVHKAFAALAPDGQVALERDLLDLIGRFNRSTGSDMVAPATYLEVIIRKT